MKQSLPGREFTRYIYRRSSQHSAKLTVSVKTAPEMTCSRIYLASSLVTGKGNALKRYFFTGAGESLTNTQYLPVIIKWSFRE